MPTRPAGTGYRPAPDAPNDAARDPSVSDAGSGPSTGGRPGRARVVRSPSTVATPAAASGSARSAAEAARRRRPRSSPGDHDRRSRCRRQPGDAGRRGSRRRSARVVAERPPAPAGPARRRPPAAVEQLGAGEALPDRRGRRRRRRPRRRVVGDRARPSSWPDPLVRRRVGRRLGVPRQLGRQLAAEGVDQRLLGRVDQRSADVVRAGDGAAGRARPGAPSALTASLVGAGQRHERDRCGPRARRRTSARRRGASANVVAVGGAGARRRGLAVGSGAGRAGAGRRGRRRCSGPPPRATPTARARKTATRETTW